MNLTNTIVGLALLLLGCSKATQSSGAKLTNPPPADKAQAESYLRDYGIQEPVMALRESDDHWMATMTSAAPTEGEVASMSFPPVYKVFKDGRVAASDGKAMKKK